MAGSRMRICVSCLPKKKISEHIAYEPSGYDMPTVIPMASDSYDLALEGGVENLILPPLSPSVNRTHWLWTLPLRPDWKRMLRGQRLCSDALGSSDCRLWLQSLRRLTFRWYHSTPVARRPNLLQITWNFLCGPGMTCAKAQKQASDSTVLMQILYESNLCLKDILL